MKEGFFKNIMSVFSGFRIGKAAMAATVLIGVLIGYNSGSTYMNACRAAGPLPPVAAPPVVGGGCICCSPSACPQPCDLSGTGSRIKTELVNDLQNLLENASEAVEGAGLNGVSSGIGYAVDSMVIAILGRLNQVELDLIGWWQAMWDYNQRPAMQQATRQLNAANADQVSSLQGVMDTIEQTKTMRQAQEAERKAIKTFQPSEQVCVGATLSGGLARAETISRGARVALEKTARGRGLNTKGTPAANGRLAAEVLRHEDYEAIFCDPNGGANVCAGDPKYYNADTQVTRQIYSNLTIDVDKDPKMAKTVETILDNMVGSSSAENIPRAAFDTAAGQKLFTDRRSYLARYAALRAAPQFGLGARMPGSGMGEWVKKISEDAGVAPPNTGSDNPSYLAVMHALSVDRFNSTQYAAKMITSREELEREKLMQSVFYLIRLRDYHKMLERQALALSVQVSIMAEQVNIPSFEAARKTR